MSCSRKVRQTQETQQDYGIKNSTTVVFSTVSKQNCGGPKDAALYGTINDLLLKTEGLDQCPDRPIHRPSPRYDRACVARRRGEGAQSPSAHQHRGGLRQPTGRMAQAESAGQSDVGVSASR